MKRSIRPVLPTVIGQVLRDSCIEVPIMHGELIQTLVEHRCHELCIGRCTVGIGDIQCPLLFLSWSKQIAERHPLHLQLLVRKRSFYNRRMGIDISFFYPRIIQTQSGTIFFLILELAGNDTVGHFQCTTL